MSVTGPAVFFIYVTTPLAAYAIAKPGMRFALRKLNPKPVRRVHLLGPAAGFGIACVVFALMPGGVLSTWLAWVCGIVAVALLGQGGDSEFGKEAAQQQIRQDYDRKFSKALDDGVTRREQARFRPPIWPPRKPDDWGREIEESYQVRVEQHRFDPSRRDGPAPVKPLIPSWEEHHQKEQAKDPRQIRWAQDALGEWVKVVWGNASLTPSDGGPLPVFQSMQRVETGEWVWIKLGRNVSLDWQSGALRTVEITVKRGDGTTRMRRPLGSPKHQDAPAPLAPDGGHGDARFRGADDLEAGGFVPPR